MQKKRIIILECLLLLPCFVTIVNYRTSIEVFDALLLFFGFDIRGTHLSLGEWSLLIYLVLLPLVQLMIFVSLKSPLGINVIGKRIVWFCTLFSSILAWHMYMQGIVII